MPPTLTNPTLNIPHNDIIDNESTAGLENDDATIIINPSVVDYHDAIVGVETNHDNQHNDQTQP